MKHWKYKKGSHYKIDFDADGISKKIEELKEVSAFCISRFLIKYLGFQRNNSSKTRADEKISY
jgi:hypothetical protein